MKIDCATAQASNLAELTEIDWQAELTRLKIIGVRVELIGNC
jgi:hypothetical protein